MPPDGDPLAGTDRPCPAAPVDGRAPRPTGNRGGGSAGGPPERFSGEDERRQSLVAAVRGKQEQRPVAVGGVT